MELYLNPWRKTKTKTICLINIRIPANEWNIQTKFLVSTPFNRAGVDVNTVGEKKKREQVIPARLLFEEAICANTTASVSDYKTESR